MKLLHVYTNVAVSENNLMTFLEFSSMGTDNGLKCRFELRKITVHTFTSSHSFVGIEANSVKVRLHMHCD